jgi:mannose-6-phosphate isomerase-like protein (cupin superfamily)
MAAYTVKNLKETEDLAVKHGFSETQEARFPRKDLEAEQTGLALLYLRPGMRQPFAHHQKEAEEIFVVLSGSGRVKLDDEILEVTAMDAIRISPPVTRAFEAGPDGLELLVFGPHHDDDAEMVPDHWTDADG